MRLLFAAFLIAIGMAAPAFADDASPAPTAPQTIPPPSGGPDFLFGRPRASISLSGTWVVPRAGGDLFTFVGNQLTINRSDFRRAGFTGAVGIRIAPRFDVVSDIEISARSLGSEYRQYVKADRSEITQTTKFNQAAFAVGARYFPIGRGQDISKYAFLPRRVVPWVGAGASFAHYTFLQTGEFVDFVDLSIFNHTFSSDGWAVGPHLDTGADVQIWRMFFVNVGARYTWGHANLSSDFVGFDGIDLAGFRSSTGMTIVF
jgi:hypothetical protein